MKSSMVAVTSFRNDIDHYVDESQEHTHEAGPECVELKVLRHSYRAMFRMIHIDNISTRCAR